MESRRYVLLGVLLAGVLVGLYYTYGPSEGPPPRESPTADQPSSEQELSDFTLNENLEEAEAWKITAPHASRSGDTVDLQSPNVIYTVKGDTRLIIVADRGLYSVRTQQLVLIDDVRLERPELQQVLTTDRLKWDRQARTISTTRKVRLDTPKGTLTARGMKTRLKEETIQFHSNVKFSSR